MLHFTGYIAALFAIQEMNTEPECPTLPYTIKNLFYSVRRGPTL